MIALTAGENERGTDERDEFHGMLLRLRRGQPPSCLVRLNLWQVTEQTGSGVVRLTVKAGTNQQRDRADHRESENTKALEVTGRAGHDGGSISSPERA